MREFKIGIALAVQRDATAHDQLATGAADLIPIGSNANADILTIQVKLLA